VQKCHVIVKNFYEFFLPFPLIQVLPENVIELLVATVQLHRRVLEVSHDGGPTLK
jgi:hypothetical protein